MTLGRILSIFGSILGWFLGAGPMRATAVRRLSITLPFASLPPHLDSTSVLLISDLHVNGHKDPALRVLDQLAGAKPDILITCGDLVESDRFIPDIAERLARIEPQFGSFAVWGNHDALGRPQRKAPRWLSHEIRPLQAMAAELAKHGIHTLTNQCVKLSIRSSQIQIIGVGDRHIGMTDLDEAFAIADSDLFTILISHNPDVATELEDRRVDVTLSGHTHAGQIVPPIIGPLTLRTRYSLPRPSGLMYVHGRPLVVSAGVGTVGVPIRINAPADVTELHLLRVPSVSAKQKTS